MGSAAQGACVPCSSRGLLAQPDPPSPSPGLGTAAAARGQQRLGPGSPGPAVATGPGWTIRAPHGPWAAAGPQRLPCRPLPPPWANPRSGPWLRGSRGLVQCPAPAGAIALRAPTYLGEVAGAPPAPAEESGRGHPASLWVSSWMRSPKNHPLGLFFRGLESAFGHSPETRAELLRKPDPEHAASRGGRPGPRPTPGTGRPPALAGMGQRQARPVRARRAAGPG